MQYRGLDIVRVPCLTRRRESCTHLVNARQLFCQHRLALTKQVLPTVETLRRMWQRRYEWGPVSGTAWGSPPGARLRCKSNRELPHAAVVPQEVLPVANCECPLALFAHTLSTAPGVRLFATQSFQVSHASNPLSAQRFSPHSPLRV